MREKIAEQFAVGIHSNPPCKHCYARADQILALICEEIGKVVLAEDEMEHAVLDTFWAEGQDQSDDRRYDKAIAQAQLNKILALLQGKETP